VTAEEVEALRRARATLARQRTTTARRLGDCDVAPRALVEDLTKTLAAIEAVDRALVDAGQPHLDFVSTPEPR
jgi:hypothetical protein